MSDEQHNQPNRRLNLHDATVFWGTLIGFFIGGILWLFRVPKRGEDTRHEIVSTSREIIERDPVKESLAEGKALAQEHQSKRE
ncbi:MAG: YtxH domain-containing protein [Chloroflexota bacterium]